MQARFVEFKTDLCALTWADVQAAVDYWQWMHDYEDYVKTGGDRPPKKPPTA